MRAKTRAQGVLVLGCFLTVGMVTGIAPAMASSADDQHRPAIGHNTPGYHGASKHVINHPLRVHYATRGISCVPFAREASGIAIKGNAVAWWDAAAGTYERGQRPEAGAVLNFRATHHMRLGHVAVVTAVFSSREIEIDHANWPGFGVAQGNISRGIRVMDVSPTNDWSAVRVEMGHSGDFGSVYPTYGFIYDRPDSGTMVANTLSQPQPTAERSALVADEVAEAPASAPPISTPEILSVDAPAHTLR